LVPFVPWWLPRPKECLRVYSIATGYRCQLVLDKLEGGPYVWQFVTCDVSHVTLNNYRVSWENIIESHSTQKDHLARGQRWKECSEFLCPTKMFSGRGGYGMRSIRRPTDKLARRMPKYILIIASKRHDAVLSLLVRFPACATALLRPAHTEIQRAKGCLAANFRHFPGG